LDIAKDKIDYTKKTDEEIIQLIHNGDYIAQDYIINKYKNLVRVKSKNYFITGADKEDIIQEGMIGLYKSIRYYNNSKNITFFCFASLCISRQIITAIRTSTRQKHIPSNLYVSLNSSTTNGMQSQMFIELITENKIYNPEEVLIGKEQKKYIENHINKDLSSLECKVLDLYLQGKSYSGIAKHLNKNEKSIDNTIQRIRKKVVKILKSNELELTL
jgi:RNA polymerase sporulation-specific sigma factor